MRDSILAARIGDLQAGADGSAILEFRFPANDPTFAGHFPTRPLLPGVYQLEMTHVTAEAALNCSLAVREITKAKFLRPIVPGETIRVELKLTDKPGSIQALARFSVKGQPAGEAIMQLARNP